MYCAGLKGGEQEARDRAAAERTRQGEKSKGQQHCSYERRAHKRKKEREGAGERGRRRKEGEGVGK